MVLPIGMTYGEIASSSKPTGPILDAPHLPLVLGLEALRSGTYVLTERVAWFGPESVASVPWKEGTITLTFEVTGPR